MVIGSDYFHGTAYDPEQRKKLYFILNVNLVYSLTKQTIIINTSMRTSPLCKTFEKCMKMTYNLVIGHLIAQQ
jgi:hypothetical protein